MSNSKKIAFLLLILLSACATDKIPTAYKFTPRESERNPFGCWTKITSLSVPGAPATNSFEGELIYMSSDSLYLLLENNRIQPVYNGSVKKAELITHRNQYGKHLLISAIFLIPNIAGAIIGFQSNGGNILLLGIPVAVTGITQASIELLQHKNRLIYPDDAELSKFKLYARFPHGKPENIDLNQLTLKDQRNNP